MAMTGAATTNALGPVPQATTPGYQGPIGGAPTMNETGLPVGPAAAPPSQNPGGYVSSPPPIGSLGYGAATNYQIPAPAPIGTNPTAPYIAPNAPKFTGTAPTPISTGQFGGLDPGSFAHSADYNYLVGEQQNAIQRGAAARGTLLTGDVQKALQANAEGLASTDYGNAFNRALGTYTTNRDTNAQNYQQVLEQYNGSLAGFNANAQAGLGYGQLGLGAQENQYGQTRQNLLDLQRNQQILNDYNAAQQNRGVLGGVGGGMYAGGGSPYAGYGGYAQEAARQQEEESNALQAGLVRMPGGVWAPRPPQHPVLRPGQYGGTLYQPTLRG